MEKEDEGKFEEGRNEETPTSVLPLSEGEEEGGGEKMNSKFKNFQRLLRKNMPLPEVILWQAIRNKQLKVKFRRQYAIKNRILDFYSPSIKLGIEIDGDSHFFDEKSRREEIENDKKLKKEGIKILRFLNSEIRENLEAVLETILKEINKKEPPPQSSPSLRGRTKDGEKK